MKRLLVTLAALSLLSAACGKDKKDDDAAATTTSAAPVTLPPTTAKLATTTTAKKPAATTTTGVNPSDDLTPPDSQTPAAGTCGDAVGGVANITLNPDIPSPRCVIVHETDHVNVKNNMGVAVFVDDGAGGFSLNQGESYAPAKVVGGYWQTGVHRLKISNKATHAVLYGGSGPEVWLK